MPMLIHCPTCGSKLKIPDSSVGKTVKCPKCSVEMMIPQPQTSSPRDQPPIPVVAPVAPPPQINPFSTTSSTGPKVLSAAANRDDEDERPSRRKSSRRSRRDEDDDRDDRGRRSNYGFRCPYCSSKSFPITVSKISTGGWVVFIVLLVTLACFPLCFIGLLMKEDYRECADCGMKIGG